MIYRKLSPSVSPSFSSPSSFLSRLGKIRETWLRRASPYGSSSYSQDRTDFHDRRIFAAAYYELCPVVGSLWLSIQGLHDLRPSLLTVLRYLKQRHGRVALRLSCYHTVSFVPRETSSMRRMKKMSEMREWRSEPVVFASYTYSRVGIYVDDGKFEGCVVFSAMLTFLHDSKISCFLSTLSVVNALVACEEQKRKHYKKQSYCAFKHFLSNVDPTESKLTQWNFYFMNEISSSFNYFLISLVD